MVPGELAPKAIDKIQPHLHDLKIGVFDTHEKPTSKHAFLIEPKGKNCNYPIIKIPENAPVVQGHIAQGSDVAIIMHTSGTKLVPITHANVMFSLVPYRARSFLTKQDYLLGLLPLFHLMGFSNS